MSEFKCSICGYTSPLKKNIARHIDKKNKCGEGATIIEIQKEINCEYCNGSFSSKPSLDRHYHICRMKNKVIEKTKENMNVEDTNVEDTNVEDTIIGRQYSTKLIKNTDLVLNASLNFMYIIHEREFFNTDQNVYKLGITKRIHNRMGHYPKGSQILCVIPVKNNPEFSCLQHFRQKFISRLDIGSEYFQGDMSEMIKILCSICVE